MASEAWKLDKEDGKKVKREAIWGLFSGAIAILAAALVNDPELSEQFGDVIKTAAPVGFGAVAVKMVFYFLKRLIKNNNVEE